MAAPGESQNSTSPKIHCIRRGHGRPLLLVHGLGGTWKTWNPILDRLAAEREVIAIDLPGFGDSPSLTSDRTMLGLSKGLLSFLKQQQLHGIDAVGHSMGGRLVLETARRSNLLGNIVALAPGGFRSGSRRHLFYLSMHSAIQAIKMLKPALRDLTSRPRGRELLLSSFCARPRDVSPQTALDEMQGFLKARSFTDILYDITYRSQPPVENLPGRQRSMVIGWGRQDRIGRPLQARRALEFFPEATLTWFGGAGHFLQWDIPEEVTRFILRSTDPDATVPPRELTSDTMPTRLS